MSSQNQRCIFDKRIDDFIQYKRSIGYKYRGSIEYQLEEIKNLLNEYCAKSEEMDLTEEAVMYVLSNKDRYQKQAYASLLREFSSYLRKKEEKAYTLNKKQFPNMKRNFKPYIYSREEINELMSITDNYKKSKLREAVAMILPFVIRIIYGCGLRVSESLNLKSIDINIKERYIYVDNGKGNKSRYIPLSESMANVLSIYDNRKKDTLFYFQNEGNHKVSKEVLYYHFKKINKIIFPDKSKTELPSLHDLRHTAAVHILEKMEERNMDLNENISLLSVFLGHETIQETEVYIHLPRYRFNDISNLDHINQIFPDGDDHG